MCKKNHCFKIGHSKGNVECLTWAFTTVNYKELGRTSQEDQYLKINSSYLRKGGGKIDPHDKILRLFVGSF